MPLLRTATSLVDVFNPAVSSSSDSLTTLLAGMSAGQWKAIPNSKMRTVGYSDDTGQSDYNSAIATANLGNTHLAAVMSGAWGSGCVDTKRARFLVEGGGHLDYYGNEVYAFSFSTLTWSRVTTPDDSRLLAAADQTFPNGNPVSCHAYSNMIYNATQDAYYCHGGTSQTGSENNTLFKFDCAIAGRNNPAGTWTSIGALPSAGGAEFWGFMDGSGNHWIYTRDRAINKFVPPSTITKVNFSNQSGAFDHSTAIYIPATNKALLIGNGSYDSFDVATPEITAVTASGSAATSITNAIGPGLALSPGGSVVAYIGGPTLLIGNPSTNSWSSHSTTDDPTNPVPSAVGDGVFGRFAYLGTVNGVTYNCYIVFTDVDTFGYVWKPDIS